MAGQTLTVVGLTADNVEDGAVVGFAEWAYDESDGTYSLGGITIDHHRQQGRGLGRAALVMVLGRG